MRLAQLDSRRAEIAVGLAFVAISGVFLRESAAVGLGWGSAGPQPGFFPSLSALVMAVGGLATVAQAARARDVRPLFASQGAAIAVLKVGVPLVGAVAALEYLGFYLMTALYMGFFTAWYGRYRWYVALGASILLPVVLFFAFERGFRVALPKSMWYGSFIAF